MTHSFPTIFSLVEATGLSEAGTSAVQTLPDARVDDFIVSPWLGLIVLSIFVITGAIAVIREIQIEEEDQ